jgi:hypothetical protein
MAVCCATDWSLQAHSQKSIWLLGIAHCHKQSHHPPTKDVLLIVSGCALASNTTAVDMLIPQLALTLVVTAAANNVSRAAGANT